MKLPKSNTLRYYFGIRLSDGETIVTTSGKKLSDFVGVSRITITRALKDRKHSINKGYIIGVSTELLRQNKGNRRQFNKDTSLLREARQQIREAYKASNDLVN